MGSSHTKGRSFEQEIGKMLLDKDGECDWFSEMTTSTGRIGAQTNLQIDVISNTFAVECKRRDDFPNWLQDAWNQIVERAKDNNKKPLLAMKADYEDRMYVIDEKTLLELVESD